jgi:hypothetical protein
MPLEGAATALAFEMNKLGGERRMDQVGPDPQSSRGRCSK